MRFTRKDGSHSKAVAEAAAEWFVDLQATHVTAEQQAEFADWLRRSPVHVEEFLQLTGLYGDLKHSHEFKALDVAALLEEAANTSQSQNVVPLHGQPFGQETAVAEETRAPSRRRGRWIVAAAASTALAMVAYPIVAKFSGTQRYQTETGEQRSLVLKDGSHVQLNVRSALSTHIDSKLREIRLDDGEALFDVAKDPSRTFRVRTPQAVIEAHGTQFNVRVKDGVTTVALLEGRVEVSGSNVIPVMLNPGQALTLTSAPPEQPTPREANLDTVTAWTKRRLVFQDTPLTEVVAEFNRYSPQPLLIADPQLAHVCITATFDSDSIRTFTDSLSAAGNLQTIRQSDGSLLIKLPAGAPLQPRVGDQTGGSSCL